MSRASRVRLTQRFALLATGSDQEPAEVDAHRRRVGMERRKDDGILVIQLRVWASCLKGEGEGLMGMGIDSMRHALIGAILERCIHT